jgi:two-component system LytT family response regulator
MPTHFQALIVEDDDFGRGLLRCLLHSVDGVELVGEAANAPEALAKLTELQPDLVLMDIDIPGGNGIELMQGLSPQPFVIFVTAHAQFVLPSFDFQVIDYLLKPVQAGRFIGSVLRAQERISERRLADLATRIAGAMSQLGSDLPAPNAPRSGRYLEQITIRLRRRIFWLDVRDIAWIEGASQYCRVHAKSDSYLLSRSLTSLERELDPGRFFRVHRSAIVNAAFVREVRFSGDGGHLIFLQDGHTVPLSRARRDVRKSLVGAIGAIDTTTSP